MSESTATITQVSVGSQIPTGSEHVLVVSPRAKPKRLQKLESDIAGIEAMLIVDSKRLVQWESAIARRRLRPRAEKDVAYVAALAKVVAARIASDNQYLDGLKAKATDVTRRWMAGDSDWWRSRCALAA